MSEEKENTSLQKRSSGLGRDTKLVAGGAVGGVLLLKFGGAIVGTLVWPAAIAGGVYVGWKVLRRKKK